jgi:probable HAF family extracellular repeat protein
VAQAINAFGIVAGYSTYNYPPYPTSHAVLWVFGHIFDLGGNNAQAMGINDLGDVVGFSVPHAFLWTIFEGMRDLGNLPGGYYSQALAINSRDEVVGFSNAADGNWHGFV